MSWEGPLLVLPLHRVLAPPLPPLCRVISVYFSVLLGNKLWSQTPSLPGGVIVGRSFVFFVCLSVSSSVYWVVVRIKWHNTCKALHLCVEHTVLEVLCTSVNNGWAVA